MFTRSQARERAKEKRKNKSQQTEAAAAEKQKTEIESKTKKNKEDRLKARQEGKTYAEEVLNRDVQGLSPEKRQALQYEANKGIQRNMQSANRKLLGEQGRHGIVGKGGVGYAQQRDLQKLGLEAQGGVQRDLDKMNEDLALKKLAAMFNIEQGEASQAQLDKQLATDELQLADERKRQREFEDRFYRQFSRV